MRHLLFVALTAATISAVDATGTWTGTLTPSGRDPGPAHMVLKQEGDTLTGTAGPSPSEQHTIQNGRVEDGRITFELTAGGGVMKFVLKQEGDEISGDVSREHDGQTQTAAISVKRTK